MIANKFVDWAKSLSDHIHLNKNTNTTEIGNNLKVGDALIIGTNGIKKANLDQAEISTDTPIVEKMPGYSFDKQTSTKGTITYTYASICKNGNKLTLVNAFTFNKNTGETGHVVTGRFMIPSSVTANIFPSFSSNTLDLRSALAFRDYTDIKTIISGCTKYDNYSVYSFIDISSLTAGVDYYIRQEITILLSDNLAA